MIFQGYPNSSERGIHIHDDALMSYDPHFSRPITTLSEAGVRLMASTAGTASADMALARHWY